jgi:hypothetical protein
MSDPMYGWLWKETFERVFMAFVNAAVTNSADLCGISWDDQAKAAGLAADAYVAEYRVAMADPTRVTHIDREPS